jgi:cell wall-associated NlpC family hydrolase
MSPSTTAQGGNIVVASAIAQLGKPYVWDTPIHADDPNPASFDCSGLAMWCYHKAGITLAHFTGAQYAQLKHRPFSQAQPGDLCFFQDNTGAIYHVGIFVGGGQIIEAPDVGIPVRYRSVTGGTTDLMAMVGVYSGSQNPVDTITQVQTADQLGAPTTADSTGSIGKGLAAISSIGLWQRVGLGLLAVLIIGLVAHSAL